MERTITLCGREVPYTLERKYVKNINLRVRPNGTVSVSASRAVAVRDIESFMQSKAEFIVRTLDRFAETEPDETDYSSKETDARCREEFSAVLASVFPLFTEYRIPYPVMKILLMKTRWGVCNIKTKTVTLNKRLIAKPHGFIIYVAAHELAHLVVPNHSAAFYAVLTSVLPNWKELKKLGAEVTNT